MEKPSIEEIEKQGKIRAAQINNALGIFISFFGIIVSVAIFFTETFIGQMTNLVAGVLLFSIGLGMILVARKTIKNLS